MWWLLAARCAGVGRWHGCVLLHYSPRIVRHRVTPMRDSSVLDPASVCAHGLFDILPVCVHNKTVSVATYAIYGSHEV